VGAREDLVRTSAIEKWSPPPARQRSSTFAGGSAAHDHGGGEGGEDGDSPMQTAGPQSSRPNGECIPAQVFQDNIDDFVAYNFIVQHCLSREATDDYLHQRRSAATCRTPHELNSMVESSVDLVTKKVDCCSAG